MNLRQATTLDIPKVLEFAELFHKNSPFKDLPFDRGKVELVIFESINSPSNLCLLLLDNGEPVGSLIATAQAMLFGNFHYASEIMFWVHPNHRGKKSWELVNAYLYWAELIGCKMACMSLLEDELKDKLDKAYRQMNFVPTESSYMRIF